MLTEESQHNLHIKKYFMLVLKLSTEILEMFTSDKIDKTTLFFDLLDIENAFYANLRNILEAILAFVYKENTKM